VFYAPRMDSRLFLPGWGAPAALADGSLLATAVSD
jgi:hypothetical protein